MPITVSRDSAKRALLERLVDDAGLFPPAQRPMREALAHHRRHAESAYAWVGGRFVLPASRADEFAARRDEAGETIDLSVILDDAVEESLRRIERLRALPGVTISSLELLVPGELQADALLRATVLVAARFAKTEIVLWCESPYAGAWPTPPDVTLQAVAAVRRDSPANITLGAKVRCGGPTDASVPTVDDLAAFVLAAQRHNVPWKATAGLHHPVRGTYDRRMMHGFLNLFVPGVALHAGALTDLHVTDVIAEADPRAFLVDPMHVGWRDVRVDADAVAAAREHCVAYGSCSFAEPVNDLRELGILA